MQNIHFKNFIAYLDFSSYDFNLEDVPYALWHIFKRSSAFFCAQAEFLHKHSISIGIGITSISTLYSLLFEKGIGYRILVLIGGLQLLNARHQMLLQKAIAELSILFEKTKERLKLTESALSDRQVLLNELSRAKAQEKELSQTVAELSSLLGFFQNENFKKTIESLDPALLEEQKKDLAKKLASIEKVCSAVKDHFQINREETSSKLSEVLSFLTELKNRDLDKMALLIEINKGVKRVEEKVDKLS